ncbi:MAG TPA: MobF family relaxase, partial [Acidimicrobiales bacterium]|nr:MobF family relaxase [Acidimicrobiales bacterium]
MLVINSASATGVAYWQRSALHSCWLGQGATLLGLTGEVDPADLRSVMLGQRPRSAYVGTSPLTSRPGLRRRHGWDLIFAAPKSVSLLTEAGSHTAALELRQAYRRAVTDAVATLEGRAAWLRAGGAQVPADGVVAAAFEHVANDAGHPHLHTHVVLANLGAIGDGRWGCLVGNELWRWREGIGAGFHLALRSHLTEAGFGFRWAISEGGAGEITSVPVEARSAASSRSRGLRAEARSFGSGSAASERRAQARTRYASRSTRQGSPGWGPAQAEQVLRRALGEPAPPSPPPVPAPVAAALAARGSTFGEADVLVALAETTPAGLDLQQAADWARSWCRANRPIQGVGGPAGPATATTAATATAPGMATAKKWTTSLADRLDQRVVELAAEARFTRTGQVMPDLAASELAGLGTPPGVASEAMRLACGPDGVAIVPKGPWLAQAACIDAARAVWQAAGMTVHLACPSELSARRWRAITSLHERSIISAGLSSASREDRRDRVLVVDAADHLSPTNLVRLLEGAGENRTRLVLVLGGTVPGNGPSLARSLDELAEERLATGIGHLPPAWSTSFGWAANAAVSLPGIAVHGSLTGSDAMAQVVQAWAGEVGLRTGTGIAGPSAPPGGAEAWAVPAGAVTEAGTAGVPGGAPWHPVPGADRWHPIPGADRWHPVPGTDRPGVVPPLMVAFGPAEAEALNLAARTLWLGLHSDTAGGQHAGPPRLLTVRGTEARAELALGERRYAVGDRVVALRRIGGVKSATFGSVVSLGERSLMVDWEGPESRWRGEVGPEHSGALGYGYATTVPYLRSSDEGRQGLLVLGDPLELAARSERALGAWVTVAGPGWPAFGPSGTAARRRAAVSELATNWPDREMLELAGPRPLGLAGRRRWAEIVVSCALRRELGLSSAGALHRDPAELGVADLGGADLREALRRRNAELPRTAPGPSRDGPSRDGPSRAGPSAAGPSAAGPSAAGPSAAGPRRRSLAW